MSGAGRGTPRVGPFQGDLPQIQRVAPATADSSSLVIYPVSSAKWSTTWSIARNSALALNAAGQLYEDQDSRDSFGIPLGALRGALELIYTGEVGVGGQLGVTLQWGDSNLEVSYMVDVANLSYPASGSPRVSTTRYVERLATVPTTGNTPIIVSLPFWVPPVGDLNDGDLSLEDPFITLRMFVQEIGGAADGASSVNISRLVADNFGQAQPVARL